MARTYHTPAPWHFDPKTKLIANAHGLIAEVLPVCIEATPEALKTEAANAALITAAPDLLAALKATEGAIEEATDIMLYEDGEPVTFLESWEIERAYGALVTVLVQVHETIRATHALRG